VLYVGARTKSTLRTKVLYVEDVSMTNEFELRMKLRRSRLFTVDDQHSPFFGVTVDQGGSLRE
jgi:hypothetical protein